MACSGYPDCRHTENLTHDTPCRECGGEVIIISTRRGRIYKCKKCETSSFYPPIDEKCPSCGKGMVMKRGESFCPDCHKPKKKKKK
jgi:DNA topoisomerase-1